MKRDTKCRDNRSERQIVGWLCQALEERRHRVVRGKDLLLLGSGIMLVVGCLCDLCVGTMGFGLWGCGVGFVGRCCCRGGKKCGHHRLEHSHLGLHKLHLIGGEHSLLGDTKDQENGGLIDRIILPFYDSVKLSIIEHGVVVTSETWKQFFLGCSC